MSCYRRKKARCGPFFLVDGTSSFFNMIGIDEFESKNEKACKKAVLRGLSCNKTLARSCLEAPEVLFAVRKYLCISKVCDRH